MAWKLVVQLECPLYSLAVALHDLGSLPNWSPLWRDRVVRFTEKCDGNAEGYSEMSPTVPLSLDSVYSCSGWLHWMWSPLIKLQIFKNIWNKYHSMNLIAIPHTLYFLNEFCCVIYRYEWQKVWNPINTGTLLTCQYGSCVNMIS